MGTTHRFDCQIPGELLAVLANADGEPWLWGALGQRRGDLQIPARKSNQVVQYRLARQFQLLMIGGEGPGSRAAEGSKSTPGIEKQTLYSIRRQGRSWRRDQTDPDTPRN